jgi:hypothetical protein
MTTITTIGLDLAKKVFQVHGVDAEDSPTRSLSRVIALARCAADRAEPGQRPPPSSAGPLQGRRRLGLDGREHDSMLRAPGREPERKEM